MIYGIFAITISRTDGWHFGKIGHLIERADKTSRVLDVKYHILLPSALAVGNTFDLSQWAALLKSVSAYDMYRKKYGKLTALNISEFLILDELFPRSMNFCLIQAEKSLNAITGNEGGFSNSAEKKLGKLKATLEFADVNDIFDGGLHEYVDTFQKELNGVSSAVYDSFFANSYESVNLETTNQ